MIVYWIPMTPQAKLIVVLLMALSSLAMMGFFWRYVAKCDEERKRNLELVRERQERRSTHRIGRRKSDHKGGQAVAATDVEYEVDGNDAR